uniref:GPI mannosyltransferase 2 n=1 Tax=Phytophthora ramorum TaxID=164328 RepID=H3HBV9_PHYRM
MEHRVVAFAAASRACVTLLALATSAIVTPYDTSSHLQVGASPLAALSNWDGVYFTHIALHGYDFEHFHAFFPLYPLLVRWLARLLPLQPASAILASGWFVSNVSFVLSALFLYRLGRVVLQDEAVARRAAYLFCVAPSSIFMSAVYSESLMCLLSFSGLYFLARHAEAPKPRRAFRDLVYCSLLFGAASATRSNGILLSSMVPYCPSLFQRFGGEVSGNASMEDRSWCAEVMPNFSAMYMFIQSEYWNVGLFRYYELKQIPNFLLAAPIIVLSLHALQGKATSGLTIYGRLVVGYFLLYTVLGSVLFPSFYPWT